jgi:uroporphyrin-III C-methyltransferase/precorrin-2 dehydrogenase/sirohydrochlorin ferrochelatase
MLRAPASAGARRSAGEGGPSCYKRRMHSLPVFLRLAGRPVILLGDGVTADAKRRLLERAGASIVGEDGDAALAIVAIEDEDEAEEAVSRLRARGILVNATDRPALCDFTLPAIVDRDPVLIAIGTGGASAALAKALRQRIEALLPAGLGGLAAFLHGARDGLRARWPGAAERRHAIDAALDVGGPLDPLVPVDPAAMAAWLETGTPTRPDRIVRIALRSGDPDDLTLGTARLLGQADMLCHDAAVPPSILDRARADAIRIVGDAPPGASGLIVVLSMD